MKHFKAKISDGQLSMDRKELRRALRFMPEGRYLLVLINMENERTERDWQKFYRVILKEMSLDTGYSPTEMHEFAKTDVLSKMKLSSTTELDSIHWREYFEYLKDWALEKFDFAL